MHNLCTIRNPSDSRDSAANSHLKWHKVGFLVVSPLCFVLPPAECSSPRGLRRVICVLGTTEHFQPWEMENFEADTDFNQGFLGAASPKPSRHLRDAEGTLTVPVPVKSVTAVHKRQLINNRGSK